MWLGHSRARTVINIYFSLEIIHAKCQWSNQHQVVRGTHTHTHIQYNHRNGEVRISPQCIVWRKWKWKSQLNRGDYIRTFFFLLLKKSQWPMSRPKLKGQTHWIDRDGNWRFLNLFFLCAFGDLETFLSRNTKADKKKCFGHNEIEPRHKTYKFRSSSILIFSLFSRNTWRSSAETHFVCMLLSPSLLSLFSSARNLHCELQCTCCYICWRNRCAVQMKIQTRSQFPHCLIIHCQLIFIFFFLHCIRVRYPLEQ